MKTLSLNTIELNVFAENEINKVSIDNLKKVLPQLEKYKGKKIHLANGTRAKGFEVEVLEYSDKENQINLRTFISFYNMVGYTQLNLRQDLIVPTKAHVGGGYSVSYFNKDLTIGRVVNGVLESIVDLEQIITDYRLSTSYKYTEVKELIKKQEALEEEARKIGNIVNKFKKYH